MKRSHCGILRRYQIECKRSPGGPGETQLPYSALAAKEMNAHQSAACPPHAQRLRMLNSLEALAGAWAALRAAAHQLQAFPEIQRAAFGEAQPDVIPAA